MIFSSPIFIIIFLPLVLLFFWTSIFFKFTRITKIIIILCSLFFYAWWDISYVPLIFITILFNFFTGNYIFYQKEKGQKINRELFFGIVMNLIPLMYFKYTSFFLSQFYFIDNTFASKFEFLLPLGISFYTFQQISYLVDIARGLESEKSFIDFSFFVLFFPQLIAGPIVRYNELNSQINFKSRNFNFEEDLSIGITIFTNGLFKKIVLADIFANYVNPSFVAVESNISINSLAAWIAAISYVFQLYFDFSGYSDMAIGISRCFSIKLPINFNSPYKELSVTDFWRNWHITLTRFIKNYIYPFIAMPITRNISKIFKSKKVVRRVSTFFSTMIIFTIIGFWHGAGWTFIIFGVIHGVIVALESIYLKSSGRNPNIINIYFLRRLYLAIILTITFVIFRAPDLSTAFNFLRNMFIFDFYSIEIDFNLIAWTFLFFIGLLIVYLLPNLYQILRKYDGGLMKEDGIKLKPITHALFTWNPNLFWLTYISLSFFISLIFMSRGVVEFIYFDF